MPHGLAPLLPRQLLGRQNLSHAVGQDFGARARHRSKPGCLEDFQQRRDLQAFLLGQPEHFNRRESPHVHPMCADHSEGIGVIGKCQVGVHAALEEDRVAAQLLGFQGLRLDLLQRQGVSTIGFDLVLERTERTIDVAEIGVVDHTKRGPSGHMRTVATLALGVSGRGDGGPVVAGKERPQLVGRKPMTVGGMLEDRRDVGLHGHWMDDHKDPNPAPGSGMLISITNVRAQHGT